MDLARALSPGFALALLASAPIARAADDVSRLPTRIGVVPVIGTGVAKLTGSAPFPDVIGLSTLGGELHAELPPYGAFFRFAFHSSGVDGRWVAPTFALGGSYRLFGNGVDELALLARGGILFERWHATNAACPIDLFFPSTCKELAPPAPTGVISSAPPQVSFTGDVLGAFAGVRAELPVRLFFLAIDLEGSAGGGVGGPAPSGVFELRAALSFGFRDATANAERRAPQETEHVYKKQ